MANDAVAAVVHVLAGLASDRIFGASLPDDDSETPHMPREAIVVRDSGGAGAFGGGYMPTVDDRVDVRCYGATAFEAKQLQADVSLRLHQARDVDTPHGRLVWAARAGGPSAVTETQTGWPLNMTSWQVFGTWLDGE